MATKHSTSSKALKAKSPRKRAKPAKPKEPGDAVSALLTMQRKLLASLEGAEQREQRSAEDGRKSDAETYRKQQSALVDRLAINCDDLGFLTPKTKDGAVFALVVAYASFAELDGVQDAYIRTRRKRRGVRLLYSLLHYLAGPTGLTGRNPGDWLGDNLNRIIRNYMPPWENPHEDFRWGKELLPLTEEAAS